jgi:predicted TPR repeat methyltransferase
MDISSGILEKARARGCYDALIKSELTAFLNETKETYDLIFACDTFNYFGVLQPVLCAAVLALKPHGLIAFTVEDDDGAADSEGWHLAMHGRYVHNHSAIQSWLNEVGFQILVTEVVPLRQELGKPVHARIYVASRLE